MHSPISRPRSLGATQQRTKNMVFAAFFLSGLVGLVYETIWMRMLTFVFGSTTLAVSTALAAFMAGLALGGYVIGKYADKIKNHLMAYVILEILVGLYGMSTLLTLTNLDKIYVPLLSTLHSDFYLLTAVRFTMAFIVIGVGAFLMGGTLPVISRIIIKEKDTIGEQFASIYAVNTFGAVFGVLLAGYFLIPVLGLRNGIGIAAIVNFVIAAGCFFFLLKHSQNTSATPLSKAKSEPKIRAQHEKNTPEPHAMERESAEIVSAPRIRILLIIAFAISGFASLACQVLWTKSLALIIGSSVYAFTIMLATFLFGIAAGSVVIVALFNKVKQRQYFWFGLIQVALAFSVLLGALLIGTLPMVFLSLTKWLPHNFFGIQLVEFSVAFLAMLPSTLLMGAAFPLVCRIYAGDVIKDLGTRIGFIYAINTVGAVTGALAAGFILIPSVGTQATFKILAGLYLVIGLVFLIYAMETRRKWGAVGGAVLAGVLIAALSPAWNPVLMNSNFPYLLRTLTEKPEMAELILGGKAIYANEGISGSVMIHQLYDGTLDLNINGHSEGGTQPQDMNAQIEQAVLPLVLHKAPRKILLVGLGAGITLGALLQSDEVEQIDVLEISSGAIEANRFFAQFNNDALNDKRVNIIVDDGRHFMAHTQKKYDLVMNTPSYSWVSGTANIFTQEFYNLARARLEPEGIFVSWFHLFSITPPDIKRFVGTVNSVFPHTSLWLVSSNHEFIVLGSEKPLTVDYALIQKKLKSRKLANELARVSSPTPEAIIGLYLMSGEEAARYSAGAEINTDDHPVMEFSIPRHMFTWHGAANMQSLIGRRYAASLPLNSMVFEQGEGRDRVIPALGLKSRLPGWEISASFVNTYDFPPGGFDRRTDIMVVYKNSPYTFMISPVPGKGTSEQLKAALTPMASGGRIESGQFGGRPAFWTKHQGADYEETFVSWACPENNTFFAGRFRAPVSGQNNRAAWSSLALGLQCYNANSGS